MESGIDFGTKIPKKPIYMMNEGTNNLVCNYSVGDGEVNVQKAVHPRKNCYLATEPDKNYLHPIPAVRQTLRQKFTRNLFDSNSGQPECYDTSRGKIKKYDEEFAKHPPKPYTILSEHEKREREKIQEYYQCPNEQMHELKKTSAKYHESKKLFDNIFGQKEKEKHLRFDQIRHFCPEPISEPVENAEIIICEPEPRFDQIRPFCPEPISEPVENAEIIICEPEPIRVSESCTECDSAGFLENELPLAICLNGLETPVPAEILFSGSRCPPLPPCLSYFPCNCNNTDEEKKIKKKKDKGKNKKGKTKGKKGKGGKKKK